MIDCLAEYLNVDKGALLAPLSVLTSAILGSSVACWAVITNRKLAKLKNSMDFINAYNEDKDIAEAMREIKTLEQTSSSDLEKIASSSTIHEKAKHIMVVLNYYEAMALCIHRKIYSDEIIKEAVYTTVTDIWRIFQPYVKERRKIKNNTTYFQELEKLVETWKQNPLKTK